MAGGVGDEIKAEQHHSLLAEVFATVAAKHPHHKQDHPTSSFSPLPLLRYDVLGGYMASDEKGWRSTNSIGVYIKRIDRRGFVWLVLRSILSIAAYFAAFFRQNAALFVLLLLLSVFHAAFVLFRKAFQDEQNHQI